jgi:hypothetical protein
MIFRIDQGIALTTPRRRASVLIGSEFRHAEISRLANCLIHMTLAKHCFPAWFMVPKSVAMADRQYGGLRYHHAGWAALWEMTEGE